MDKVCGVICLGFHKTHFLLIRDMNSYYYYYYYYYCFGFSWANLWWHWDQQKLDWMLDFLSLRYDNKACVDSSIEQLSPPTFVDYWVHSI